MPVEHISDTARWVAAFRAEESERPDALFHDPYARQLAGERGFALGHELAGRSTVKWSLAVRTVVFDDVVLRAVRDHGVNLVINLACGLDMRPYRLALPPGLRWVEADLPAILAHKVSVLGDVKPACLFERVSVDLADADARRALLARLHTPGTRSLVITEGLLLYLPAEAVADLGRDLHAQEGCQQWTFDLMHPLVLAGMRAAYNRALAASGSKMQFAPWEGVLFFEALGWHRLAFHTFADEGSRLRRGFWPRVWRYARPLAVAPVRRAVGVGGGIAVVQR